MEPATKNRAAKAKARLKLVVWEETRGLLPRLLWVRLLSRLLPDATPETIADWLRLVGARVGGGTRITKLPYLNGRRHLFGHLAIGRDCLIEDEVVLDLQEHITVGDRVHLAQGAMLLTSTHQIGPKEHRAGTLERMPVVIEDDVTVGAGALICPGVRVRARAIVDARAMVNKDVPEGAFVTGNPAAVRPRTL